MRLDEYSRFDAVELADLLKRREVTPRELAELALCAIDTLNPLLNAVVESYPDRAEQADQVNQHSVFSGVPMLLKDTGATDAGKRQECGSRLGRGYVAAQDAYLTRDYKAGGLNIIGRSAMPELAMAATTESAAHGSSCNPWDLRRSTGGSSGGAAAAVAAGIVPVAHGTDTGGSIRIPAACCGIVGFKPSRGRISKGPLLDETLYGGLNHEHVLTRSVRDTAAILDISCGPRAGDALAIPKPAHSFLSSLHAPQEGLRIAITTSSFIGKPASEAVAAPFGKLVGVLNDLGHKVTEACPAFDVHASYAADDVVWGMSTRLEAQRLSRVTGLPMTDDYVEPPILECINRAKHLKLSDWFQAMNIYRNVRNDIAAFFDDYDILITPTLASEVPYLGQVSSNREIGFDEFMASTLDFCPYTSCFNITGQPAISLPLFQSEANLPIGVQLVAGYGDDIRLLRLASQLEAALPWSSRLPAIHACSSS